MNMEQPQFQTVDTKHLKAITFAASVQYLEQHGEKQSLGEILKHLLD